MSRKQALENIKIAGYNGDRMTFLRIYTESRISKKSADEAFQLGQKLRKKGAKNDHTTTSN